MRYRKRVKIEIWQDFEIWTYPRSLPVAGGRWWSLVVAGGRWWSLVVAASRWWLLPVAGGCWWLLVVAGQLRDRLNSTSENPRRFPAGIRLTVLVIHDFLAN
jgi:hypothetical protein